MAQHPFPGPGHDGDEPAPGVPARDGADEVGERYLDWAAAETEACREEAPPEEPPPGVMVYPGEAMDTDLAGLAGAGFSLHEAAGVLPPGPVLGALTAQAVEDVASLPDDELLGVVSAARRQQARAEYEELAAVAEFTRRREQAYEASKAQGDKPRQREGEFAAEELGMEMNYSYYTAGKRMDLADALSRRLPATFAGMAAGTIDGYKAKTIYEFTRYLSDEQAAQADQILAAAAPGLAPAELKQKAARLEYKLDPDGVRQRKEEAARKHRRVEARQEASGNASLAGRELAVDEALTAKNSVWAEATALCNAGLDVPLREARTMVYLDRLQNLNPWERLNPPYDPPGGYDAPATAAGTAATSPMTAASPQTRTTVMALATTATTVVTTRLATAMAPAASPTTDTTKTRAKTVTRTTARMTGTTAMTAGPAAAGRPAHPASPATRPARRRCPR